MSNNNNNNNKRKEQEWKVEKIETKGIKVYNSLANETVPFYPLEDNCISWYSCGPTVYDVAHFGHAKTYLVFDTIQRILRDYFHFALYTVMNVTDIDDKIILK